MRPRELQTVVLGGGITGLTIGRLTGAPVIFDKPVVVPSPFFVHATEEAEAFVKDVLHLGHVSHKRVAIGFADYDRMVIPSDFDLKTYAHKKGRQAYHPSPFDYLDISVPALVSELVMSFDGIKDCISKIDTHDHVLTGKHTTYHYEHLISTIPAPTFAKLSGEDESVFEFIPLRHQYVTTPYASQFLDLFDYTYFVDKSPMIRYTPTSQLGGVLEYVSDNYNQMGIVEGSRFEHPSNVSFAGRFARWEENHYLHDDIRKWSE
jgi:hypothetical protein